MGGAVFAATARGLAASRNGHDFDFRADGLHAPYCRAVAVLDDRVLVSASTGPRTTKGRLYSSPLWDDDFQPAMTGLPEWFGDNLNTHCIAVIDSNVYVGHDDSIWASDDKGSTWALLTSGLPKVTCLA